VTDVDQSATVPDVPRRSDFVRRRLQVIDAFLDLVLEGDPSPDPVTVAERAGVSRASVFRYFATLDELRTEAMGGVLERFIDLFELDEPSARSSEARIVGFVEARLRFHETLHPLALLQRRHAADGDDAAAPAWPTASRYHAGPQETPLMSEKPQIPFDDFIKLDLRVATITACEPHPGADRLLKIRLDDGTADGRQVCAGIRAWYEPADLVGRHVVIVANLEPRKIRGEMSQGMILAASDLKDGDGEERDVVVLMPEKPVKPGSGVS